MFGQFDLPETKSVLWRTLLLISALALGLLAACSDDGASSEADTDDDSSKPKALILSEVARFESGVFDDAAMEIAAWEPKSGRIFAVNGSTRSIDIFVIETGPEGIALFEDGKLELSEQEFPTSVAIHGDLVAVAAHEETDEGRPGKVIFFNLDGTHSREVAVGDLPDMVIFTPDGQSNLVV